MTRSQLILQRVNIEDGLEYQYIQVQPSHIQILFLILIIHVMSASSSPLYETQAPLRKLEVGSHYTLYKIVHPESNV